MEIHFLRRPWLDLAARGWSERTGHGNVCTGSLSEGALFSSASTSVDPEGMESARSVRPLQKITAEDPVVCH